MKVAAKLIDAHTDKIASSSNISYERKNTLSIEFIDHIAIPEKIKGKPNLNKPFNIFKSRYPKK